RRPPRLSPLSLHDALPICTFSSAAGPDAAKPGAAAGPGVPAAVSATGPGREAAHHQAAAPAAAATTMIKTKSPARLRTVHPSGGGAVRRRVGTVWKTFHIQRGQNEGKFGPRWRSAPPYSASYDVRCLLFSQ